MNKSRLTCMLVAFAAACSADSLSSIQRAVADPYDNICIPQIASGGGWKTTITLVNMEARTSNFVLLFADSSGRDMPLRLNTPNGVVTSNQITGSLPANGSVTYETADSGALTQASGLLVHNGLGGVLGTVAGHAIFQQQLPGKPAFEAVSPLSPFTEARVRLPFDNTAGFQTGVAVVNTDTVQATITGQAYNERGELIGTGNFTLPAVGQRAFVLSDVFGFTRNQRGMIELSTSARSFCSTGLRFHPSGAFTSTPPLSLPTW